MAITKSKDHGKEKRWSVKITHPFYWPFRIDMIVSIHFNMYATTINIPAKQDPIGINFGHRAQIKA